MQTGIIIALQMLTRLITARTLHRNPFNPITEFKNDTFSNKVKYGNPISTAFFRNNAMHFESVAASREGCAGDVSLFGRFTHGRTGCCRGSDCLSLFEWNELLHFLIFPFALRSVGRHMLCRGISHVCGCNYDVSMTKVGKLERFDYGKGN